jgi:hypothetical protein
MFKIAIVFILSVSYIDATAYSLFKMKLANLNCRPSQRDNAATLCDGLYDPFVPLFENNRGCNWALNCFDPAHPEECICDYGYFYEPVSYSCLPTLDELVANCDIGADRVTECPAFGIDTVPHPLVCGEYTG